MTSFLQVFHSELPNVLHASPSDLKSFDNVISRARYFTSTCDYSVIRETELHMPIKSMST